MSGVAVEVKCRILQNPTESWEPTPILENPRFPAKQIGRKCSENNGCGALDLSYQVPLI
jgi:hypothetical protein